MEDLGVTASVSMSTENVERAFDRVGDKAAQMANKVAKEAEKAGAATDNMGAGAEKSAEKFTRADSLMRAAIMKSTRELELLGKTASQRFEAQIDFKGLEKAKFQEAISGLQAMESALSVAKAREAEFAAQNAFSLKAAQAKELVKASEYARWWAQELEKVEAAEKRLAGQNSFIASLKSQADAIGKTKADLLEMQAAQMGVATQAAPFIAKMREAEAGVGKMGISAAQTAAALRGVPAQFTDIITSLQGGQAPLTVFLQQGGQLRDMFGGAGAAARALGGYVAGLINPFTLAAAGAAALAVAYSQGSKEADAYRLAMVGTGNAAGATAGQLKSYAQEISGVVGTQGKAAESLAAFVSTGRVSRDVLKEASQAAIAWERATGQAVGTTAKQFADLGKDPLQAVLKLNEGTNFLTESVYRQIKSLEEQGKTADAAAVAQRAYADALTGRAGEIERNLGSIETAWNKVKDAAKGGWDAILNVGRAETNQDRLAATRKQIADLENRLAAGSGFSITAGGAATGRPDAANNARLQAQLLGLQAQAAALEGVAFAAKTAAEAEAERAKQMQATAAWDKEGAKYLTDKAKLERDLTAARNEGLAAGKSQAEIEKRLAQIRESYAKKGGSGGLAAENRELEQQAKLLAELSGLSSSFAKDWELLNKAFSQGKLTTEQLEKEQAKLLAKQPFVVAGEKAHAEAIKESAKAAAESSKHLSAWYDAREKESQGFANQINARREEVTLMGLSAEAVAAYTQAKYEQQAAEKEAYAAALESASFYAGEYAEAYNIAAEAARNQAKQLRELGGLEVEKVNKEAAKKAKDEWERAAADIERALTDSLMRGFESGKDFAENLIASLKNMFSTLVLRPVISAALSPVAGAVNGFVGNAVGGAAGSGIGSGIATSIGTSAIGSAFSLGLTNFGTGLGSTLANGVFGGIGTNISNFGTLAGAGNLSGALGVAAPYLAGIGALYAIIKGLDDSGTYHTGGAAQYNAATGLTSGQSGADYNIGFGRVEAGAETISAVGSIAQGIGTALNSVATAFGQRAGYEVATAFARDSSGDNEWGALRISKDGKELLNWDDTRMSKWAPKEFGDGEAGYKEYLAAVAKDTRQVLLDMDLPSWADKMLTSIGDSASMEDLQAVITQIGVVQTAFVGMSRNLVGFADYSEEARGALMELSGGIEALASNASTYYSNFYSADEQRANLEKQLNEEFAKLNLTLPDIDATDARAQYRALIEAQDSSTEEGRKAIAMLLQLAGVFAQVTQTAEDAQAAMEAQAREAQSQAMRNLQEAYSRERKRLEAQLESIADTRAAYEQQQSIVQETYDTLAGVFDLLHESVIDLYGSVESTVQMQAEEAARFIAQSVSNAQITGYLPEQDKLGEAISAARAGIDAGVYANSTEQDFAKLVLAGQLRALEEVAGKQKTDAEKQLEALEKQLKSIDDQTDAIEKQLKLQQESLDYWQEQIDIANGVYDATLSVADAIAALSAALGKPTTPTTPPPGGRGGGGPVFGPGPANPSPATAKYSRVISLGTAGVGYDPIRDQSLIEHLDKLSPLYHSFDGTGDLVGLANAIKAAGGSIADLSILSGLFESDWVAALAKVGIPAFAVGTNYVPRDMLAQIHEGEAIVPKAFNPWANGGAASGSDNTALIAEIRSLREEVAGLRAAAEETAGATGATADVLVRVTQNGNGMVTAAAPI